MYSLYYGVVIIKEIYTPETPDEEATYHFYEARELLLLKSFVFNEIIVGAIIIVQLIQALCCGKIAKSRHLTEIEGEGWGVDEAQVTKIRQELADSRKRTEGMRKGAAKE